MEKEGAMLVPPEDLIGELRRLADEVESLVRELDGKPSEERLREVRPAWLVTRERLVDVVDAIADDVSRLLGVD